MVERGNLQRDVSLTVEAGDKVEQGQVIASIDSPELNSQFSQELAVLEQQKIEVGRYQIQMKTDDPNIRPVQTRAVGTTSAFFAMFAPPFRFGSGWNTQADEQGAAQIVLGKTMNDRLFGGENSVGRRINLNNMPMEIVGVIGEWSLSWRIYDRGYQRGYPHDFYVPAQYALNSKPKP